MNLTRDDLSLAPAILNVYRTSLVLRHNLYRVVPDVFQDMLGSAQKLEKNSV